MNGKKKLLSEEEYQKNKKKISGLALIIIIIGLLIGGSLITIGLIKQSKVNSDYSDERKANLQAELETEKINLEREVATLEAKRAETLAVEKQKLEVKKAELTAKGIKYDFFAKYDDGESYDLKIVTNALDPSTNNCAFDEYINNVLTSTYCLISNKMDKNSKNIEVINGALDANSNRCIVNETKNNAYTSKYCSLKTQLENKTDWNKDFALSESIPFYIFGAIVIIISGIIAISIYTFSKKREIIAFQAQQIIPIAQEEIEKIAPIVGKAGASIGKEVGPVYGDIAKEISKGIKEGLKDEDK